MRSRISILVFTLLFGLCAMLTSGNNTADAKAQQNAQWTVKLVSAKLIENNHVGNQWYTEASVNQKQLMPGQSVTLSNSKVIKLEAYAEEQDKIPDVGTASKSVQISSLKQNTNKIELKVTVTENRGRYSGNQAYWKFSYEITRKK
ncbi:hypothetical protein ACTHPF_01155 [Paenibacillus sp. SAF-054]|uniref:hypothetical protein n=1 Tax=unclassified Paenibacillus TaxID=185978 RepID=UPI003F8034A1